MLFYIDDSGTRTVPKVTIEKADWFAYGGVLFNEEDKSLIEQRHTDFVARWPQISGPLHSNEIRNTQAAFDFLKHLAESDFERFHDELTAFLCGLPVVGLTCVVDRNEYLRRYGPLHGDARLWKLCRSAFAIVVERGAKFAERSGRRLKLHVENGNATDNKQVRAYLHELLQSGAPFGAAASSKYSPMTAERFVRTVSWAVDFPSKDSKCMQVADLYLYPMTQEKYRPEYRTLLALRRGGRLIEAHVSPDEIESCGSKYYCYPTNTKAPNGVGAFGGRIAWPRDFVPTQIVANSGREGKANRQPEATE